MQTQTHTTHQAGSRTTAPKGKHNTDEDIELFRKYAQTGKADIRLRNQLAVRNGGLVHYVVHKFFKNRPEYQDRKEDLVQEGQLGLFEAIQNFDPERGFKFSTYATWWVKQSCSNYLSDSDPLIHIPAHVRTAQNKVMYQLKGEKRDASDLDVMSSTEFGITDNMLDCVKSALRAKKVTSADSPVLYPSSGDDSNQRETLLSKREDGRVGQDVLFGNEQLVASVVKALTNLSGKERNILLLRYNVITDVEKN